MVEVAAAAARGERRRAMLQRLAELGIKMAEAIVAQSAEEGAARSARPSRVCQALGLDPEHCVATEPGWMIKTVPATLSEYAKPPAARPASGAPGAPLAPSATGPPN